ncbi:hypothetical protein Pcinc_030156 [Petrolisthes cinctipes]|uniref:Uncharacterized protein n=1 Tax=Petrolisthes cinctipes TaxID=88211 RepID=A0AAE1EZC9_PETCI|nr:hypothetical protein Pcinc_030156 [Petrolisthes cinctipes]
MVVVYSCGRRGEAALGPGLYNTPASPLKMPSVVERAAFLSRAEPGGGPGGEVRVYGVGPWWWEVPACPWPTVAWDSALVQPMGHLGLVHCKI